MTYSNVTAWTLPAGYSAVYWKVRGWVPATDREVGDDGD
jgi:hypothetical protein